MHSCIRATARSWRWVCCGGHKSMCACTLVYSAARRVRPRSVQEQQPEAADMISQQGPQGSTTSSSGAAASAAWSLSPSACAVSALEQGRGASIRLELTRDLQDTSSVLVQVRLHPAGGVGTATGSGPLHYQPCRALVVAHGGPDWAGLRWAWGGCRRLPPCCCTTLVGPLMPPPRPGRLCCAFWTPPAACWSCASSRASWRWSAASASSCEQSTQRRRRPCWRGARCSTRRRRALSGGAEQGGAAAARACSSSG